MADHYIVYHLIRGFTQQGFMIIPAPPVRIVEEKIIPSLGETPPIYVRWYRQQFGQNTLHLLTYTHQGLTDLQVSTLFLKAARLVWGDKEGLDG
jgi:hypothetical protein